MKLNKQQQTIAAVIAYGEGMADLTWEERKPFAVAFARHFRQTIRTFDGYAEALFLHECRRQSEGGRS